MIPDDKSFLRKADHELYTVDGITPKPRSFLHEKKLEAPDHWSDMTPSPESVASSFEPMKKTSIFKKIFGASLGFLVIAVIIAGLSYLSGGNSISTKNVDITLTTKTFVDGGESLPVTVSLVNRNKLNMELATLVLEYPEGNAANLDAITRISRDVGTLPVGETHNESFVIKLYGEENTEKKVTARIEFRVSGSNAIYDKEESVPITIRTSPVRLTLDMPQAVIPNQEVAFKFNLIGNGLEVLTNTALVVQYPPGFTFTRAVPASTTGNNVWYLGDIPPSANKTITIYGSIAGGASDAKTLRASVGSQNKNNESQLDRVYNTLAQVVPLTNAFLDAQVRIGQDNDAIIPIGASEDVTVSIPWTNTLAEKITNAQIEVELSGSAYDPLRVRPVSGYFDSVANKIIWTRQQVPAFAALEPGQTGTLTFQIQPKQFSVNQITTSPTINLAINISAFNASGVKVTALAIDRKTLAIGSDINLTTRTLHATGPLQNSGPIPAKTNTETTYTLEWQITNSRNRVSAVKVSTILPTYVSWKNVMVPVGEQTNITFNEVTRELVWNVGEIPAGTGTSLPAKIVSLKVGITPSVQQKGTTPNLTDDIEIIGKDMFTNKEISFTRRAMNTQTFSEGSGPGSDGIVQ